VCHGRTGSAGKAARRAEVTCSVEDLRHLGPGLESDQVLLTVDEVLTPRPQAGHFLELRTACLMMAAGYRHFSGVGLAFLQHLQLVVWLALGVLGCLLLIATIVDQHQSCLSELGPVIAWHSGPTPLPSEVQERFQLLTQPITHDSRISERYRKTLAAVATTPMVITNGSTGA